MAPAPAPTDAELLADIRAGRRPAVDALLARYEPRIYRFGLRMCGDEEAAREVLQETLLAAFRHLGTFRGDASLSTWLYQIARSFCIKARRGRPPMASLDEDLAAQVVDPAPAPDARAHARELGLALSEAIGRLRPEHREAIVLRDVEGLPAEEAAALAGVEVGALKSRLHRAREALRAELAGLLDGDPGGGCPALAAQLAAYGDVEIDQATCVTLEAHLAACPRCAGACGALERSVAMCRSLPGGAVPAPVRAAVRRALDEALGLPAR